MLVRGKVRTEGSKLTFSTHLPVPSGNRSPCLPAGCVSTHSKEVGNRQAPCWGHVSPRCGGKPDLGKINLQPSPSALSLWKIKPQGGSATHMVPRRAVLLQPSYSTQQISSLVGIRSTRLHTSPASATAPKHAKVPASHETQVLLQRKCLQTSQKPSPPQTKKPSRFQLSEESDNTVPRRGRSQSCLAQDAPPGQRSPPDPSPSPSAGGLGQPRSCPSSRRKFTALKPSHV